MTNTVPAAKSVAERFRVEGFVGRSKSPYNIGGKEWYITVQVAPGGNGTRYLCCDGKLRGIASDPDGIAYYPTEAEAQFRLLLYQSPREALAAFFKATGGEYEGTCAECLGTGWQSGILRVERWTHLSRPDKRCRNCHGTGGPPSRDTLGIAADWFEERGCEVEAGVLRSVAKGCAP